MISCAKRGLFAIIGGFLLVLGSVWLIFFRVSNEWVTRLMHFVSKNIWNNLNIHEGEKRFKWYYQFDPRHKWWALIASHVLHASCHCNIDMKMVVRSLVTLDRSNATRYNVGEKFHFSSKMKQRKMTRLSPMLNLLILCSPSCGGHQKYFKIAAMFVPVWALNIV